MNSNLLLDFSVDKIKNTITVKREFAADLKMVWDTWTKAELLDLWWAPKPYRNQTKLLNFKVGGFWLYAMISPENQAHWCRADYKTIEPFKYYSLEDAFCDEEGVINNTFPRSVWTNSFHSIGDHTQVICVIQYKQLSDLEKIIELGFKEGFTMALKNLTEYLEEQVN